MSFMDKLKAMFSGGSSASEHDHSHHDHDHGPMDDVAAPPAEPLDPLGTTDPEPMPGDEDRTA